jgi:formamidopyrimidine-DNA glycosylase
MPELPEVESIARGLRAQIEGARIEAVRCALPDLLAEGAECLGERVQGHTIRAIQRHGKYLFLLLGGGLGVALHLGMTGQLLLVPRAAPADRHTHLEILLARRSRKLAYRDVRKFGRMSLLESGPEGLIRRKRLGPDALLIEARQLHGALQRTRRSIKACLLDQRVIAGLGNIYTDEVLFRRGLHPACPAAALAPAEVSGLLRTTRAVLRAAIERNGTTISDYVNARGEKGRYQQKLLVYDRKGKPCRRCGTPIARAWIAGRGTYFCPSCQKGQD